VEEGAVEHRAEGYLQCLAARDVLFADRLFVMFPRQGYLATYLCRVPGVGLGELDVGGHPPVSMAMPLGCFL
jgi:hypothetical protein